ncbi:unnamed protein product [Pleuronectes platessa]|uniref:Uncharacterized protein n=1 Tax=Pleuronectes platessa TaxID=8262 RepID=A0A9N7UPK7_PLEPL|nr:unnamed protein product [Pleuronectes platessa]
MPVVISSRISVNCHPVTGRLHVGHRRPLLPRGLTGSVRDPLTVTSLNNEVDPLASEPHQATSDPAHLRY